MKEQYCSIFCNILCSEVFNDIAILACMKVVLLLCVYEFKGVNLSQVH